MNQRFLKSMPKRPFRAAVLAVSFVLLAACGNGSGDESSASPAGAEAADTGLGHIHGVAMDPADNAIYVAAHFGVFKIESSGRASRVGENRQDTMGFTIVGPRTFLASGHPAVEEMTKGAPPHLGLIRSTDAGRTWTSVSEAGKSDFHALQPAGSVLYVYDSQTQGVRRSNDGGRTWTPGARLEVNDLAAHKDHAQRVYAATPQGVQVSEDSGTTFKAAKDAPVLTHLDTLDSETLIGVARDGQIQIDKGNAGWSRLGQVPGGQVSAFTAVDEQRLLAAAEDGKVYESRDGGRTFNVLYDAG